MQKKAYSIWLYLRIFPVLSEILLIYFNVLTTEIKQARQVLDANKSERHIQGGLATREKYRHMA